MESSRKKARHETLAKPEDEDTTQINENLLNSNTYLTYDILRIIFRYLNSKDLSKAAIVCKSWLVAADNERHTRGPFCIMECFKKQQVQQEHILRIIRNLRIKPSLGLYFTPFDPHVAHFIHRSEFPARLLHQDCKHIILLTAGIIIDNIEIENRARKVVCAFLPEISDVVIKVFDMAGQLEGRTNFKEMLRLVRQISRPNCETSTCLMLFCNNDARNTAICLAKALKESENKITSLWGGMVRNQYLYDSAGLYVDNNPYCIGVLISGAIKTWSIIVDIKCNTKKQVKAKLQAWKDRIQLKKHSMGFMFVCQARGQSMYNKAGVESSIFKKLFPKVPLVGCFGDGEFGKETIIVDEVTSESGDDKSKKNAWYNEYSTVFMILTYG